MNGRTILSFLSTGFALFAMFFGAGNVVFPLALGAKALSLSHWAMGGLIISAVLLPLCGVFAMLLYEGDYWAFFKRLSSPVAFFMVFCILTLMGPVAGIPRCITVSYATLVSSGAPLFGNMGVSLFTALNVLLIFLCAVRPQKMVSVIGSVLTPLLLLALAILVVKGFWTLPHLDPSSLTPLSSFTLGLQEGYNTLDLLASFFFSSVILVSLRKQSSKESAKPAQQLLVGGLIAGILLSVVYFSFCYLAAGYHSELAGAAGHELLGALAKKILGPYAGLLVGSLVFFACFTTELALAAVFTGFFHETLVKKRLSYPFCLALTLAVTFLFGTLDFQGISALLGPILYVCYPACMALTFVNIAYKLTQFQPLKRIFYPIVFVTLVLRYLTFI